MSLNDRVRAHFDRDADRFDAIYDDRGKGLFGRLVDNHWRGVVRRRLELTLDRLAPLDGKLVLDVGCGSGRYCIAAARLGARVLGIDFSGDMIAIARKHCASAGVAERCEFVVGAFPEAVPDMRFDHAMALGFFDYVSEGATLAARMRQITRGTVVMSFPKAREWRVPFRRLRFRLNRCPLFLYTAEDVQRVLAVAGFGEQEWIDLDRDYLILARGSA